MTVRDIMTETPWVVDPNQPVRHIAQILAGENIGAVIVCDADNRPKGVITDRDIATEVVAKRLDPDSTVAGDLIQGTRVVTVEAEDPIDKAVDTMRDNAVRRLPVTEREYVVGIISQADLARHASEDKVGGLVRSISTAPDNTGHA